MEVVGDGPRGNFPQEHDLSPTLPTPVAVKFTPYVVGLGVAGLMLIC